MIQIYVIKFGNIVGMILNSHCQNKKHFSNATETGFNRAGGKGAPIEHK